MMVIWLIKEKGYVGVLVGQGKRICWRIGRSRRMDMLDDWLIKKKGYVVGLVDQGEGICMWWNK